MKVFVLFFAALIYKVHGHARLMDPPSRASMWRLGYDNPADYSDNQGFCGGLWHMTALGGKCGICGDAYDASPREHEAPYGKYANGIIVRQYHEGQMIDIQIDVTANHKGYFEFKLCPNNDITQDPDQNCFDQLPLLTSDGNTKYELPDEQARTYKLQIQLPKDVTCKQCVLQWTYVGANNWGTDEDGTSCTGCGPQEHFRACADISISSNAKSNAMYPNCRPIPPWDAVAGMDDWCLTNCLSGFCPPNKCTCD